METTEDSLSGAPVTQTLASIPIAGVLTSNTVWLRMVKRGPRYTTCYSTNGTNFVPIHDVGASLENVKVGLFAYSGADTSTDLNVAFDYFRVHQRGGGSRTPMATRDDHARSTRSTRSARSAAARRASRPR